MLMAFVVVVSGLVLGLIRVIVGIRLRVRILKGDHPSKLRRHNRVKGNHHDNSRRRCIHDKHINSITRIQRIPYYNHSSQQYPTDSQCDSMTNTRVLHYIDMHIRSSSDTVRNPVLNHLEML